MFPSLNLARTFDKLPTIDGPDCPRCGGPSRCWDHVNREFEGQHQRIVFECKNPVCHTLWSLSGEIQRLANRERRKAILLELEAGIRLEAEDIDWLRKSLQPEFV